MSIFVGHAAGEKDANAIRFLWQHGRPCWRSLSSPWQCRAPLQRTIGPITTVTMSEATTMAFRSMVGATVTPTTSAVPATAMATSSRPRRQWVIGVAAASLGALGVVVAVLLGWAFANEPVTSRTLVAAAVILAGVAIITAARDRDVTTPEGERAVA